MVGFDQLPGDDKETEVKPGRPETFHLFCIDVTQRTNHHITAGQDTIRRL